MSYSKSLTSCTKGSDSACVETGFATACCMYWEVTKVPATTTSGQDLYVSLFSLAGFPTTVGEKSYMCADPDTVTAVANVSGWWNGFTYDTSALPTGTGATYKAYCAGATALKAVGALTSLALMSAM